MPLRRRQQQGGKAAAPMITHSMMGFGLQLVLLCSILCDWNSCKNNAPWVSAAAMNEKDQKTNSEDSDLLLPGANFGVVQSMDVTLLQQQENDPSIPMIEESDVRSKLAAIQTYVNDLNNFCAAKLKRDNDDTDEDDLMEVCEIHSLHRGATVDGKLLTTTAEGSAQVTSYNSTCINTDPLCTLRAVRGDCDSEHRDVMAEQCAPACMLCFIYAAEESYDLYRARKRNEKQRQQPQPHDMARNQRDSELLRQLEQNYRQKQQQQHAHKHDDIIPSTMHLPPPLDAEATQQEFSFGVMQKLEDPALVDAIQKRKQDPEYNDPEWLSALEQRLSEQRTKAWQRLSSTAQYMQTVVYRQDSYIKVRPFCRNEEEMCTIWAVDGECTQNPNYMNRVCAPACQNCHLLAPLHHQYQQKRKEKSQEVPNTASGDGKRTSSSSTFRSMDEFPNQTKKDPPLETGSSFGVLQRVDNLVVSSDQLQQKLEETAVYIQNYQPEPSSLTTATTRKQSCRNLEPLCTFWSMRNECEQNRVFMQENCAPACQFCGGGNNNNQDGTATAAAS